MEQTERFIIITGPALTDEERSLLSIFNTTTYIPAFPNDDERESLETDIIPRIKNHEGSIRTFIILLIKNDGKVSAGLIADWYPECRDLELIYIAVNPSERKNGIGSRILQEGTARVVSFIEKDGVSVRRVYFETENPNESQLHSDEEMDPKGRIRFFGRNYGSLIVEDYYQPPLSEGKNWADNMVLCTLPVFRFDTEENEVAIPEAESSVPESELFEFLTSFYRELDNANQTPEGKEHLEMMRNSIRNSKTWNDGSIKLQRIESNSYQLKYATIASHFFIDPDPNFLEADSKDHIFNSYECDLMKYGLQDYEKRPIVTHHFKLLEGVLLRLPREYQYESEGRFFFYKKWDNEPVKVDISFNWSYHRAFEKYLATIVISPSGDSYFTEIDILKIISLLGFGSKQESAIMCEPLLISLSGNKQGLIEMTFAQLVQTVFKLNTLPILTETGITDIDLQGTNIDFQGLVKGINSRELPETTWNKTLCGLILGIFDFLRMNEGEITDTLKPIIIGESYLLQICRGNLVFLRSDTSDERIDKILISAYLIIPSAVLAFNELVITQNMELLRSLKDVNYRIKKRRIFVTDFDRYSFLANDVKKIETSLDESYIRDIFQYESEQRIIQFGSVERGLSDSYIKLKDSIVIQKNRSAEYLDKYTGRIDTLQNIILLMLAILQVATIKSIKDITMVAWIMLSFALIIGAIVYIKKGKRS